MLGGLWQTRLPQAAEESIVRLGIIENKQA
jgi:hypothetical protein